MRLLSKARHIKANIKKSKPRDGRIARIVTGFTNFGDELLEIILNKSASSIQT